MGQTLHFVWLGAKRARKNGVAEKGWRLDMAASAGLPVPNGGIILDNFYRLALLEEIVVVEDGRLHTPDPQALHQLLYTAVRFPQLDKPCAVRALFTAAAPTCLNVNVADAAALAATLCRLWTAAHDAHCDVLVQEMVDAALQGTAVSPQSTAVDIITAGDTTFHLPQLSRWQRPEPDAPAHRQRLQKLLRGLRRTFGKGDWQITWADDGRVCWLLQIKLQEHQP